MKKLMLALLIAAMTLSLCACGKTAEQKPEEEMDGMANPITEYESLAEINELMGIKLAAPAVMGVTDKGYRIYDCGDYQMAEYEFEVNGMPYTLRNASVTDDISGVYVDGKTAFPGEREGDIEYANGEDCKLARWFDLNGQYVLCVEDKGEMEQDDFSLIAEEMYDLTFCGETDEELTAYYETLVGEYADSVSQRATMTLEQNENGGVSAFVSWASSASDCIEWKMTLRLGEDGLLSYNDCEARNVSYGDDGVETFSETVYENGSGFFTPADGKLLWNGAADKACLECVFEKMP